MSEEKDIQLGLCCMNITLKKEKPPVYAARRIIVRKINELGIEELKKTALQTATCHPKPDRGDGPVFERNYPFYF